MQTQPIEQEVHQILAAILQRDEHWEDLDLDPHMPFSEIGINSVDLVEFVLQVEDRFGVSLLEDLEPEKTPDTIAGWGKLVERMISAD